MKRTIIACLAMLALPLSACGPDTVEPASPAPVERTATGADAEYIAALIEENPGFGELPDPEILGAAESFCNVLNDSESPSRAMGALLETMDKHEAEMFAIQTVSSRCSHNLYALTDYLGLL